MLDPAYTPTRPGTRPGSYPAFSMASQATSRNRRCWGSVTSASRGVKPKKAASKRSTPSSAPRAGTYAGSVRSSSGTPAAASSSSVKRRMDSTPARRLAHRASTPGAPGKRPAIPTTAIALVEGSRGRSRGAATSPEVTVGADSGASRAAARALTVR
jgi:hypothetical protein